jgi:hypothetical protein
LIALVAGTELFGIWGALFGAPLAGLVQALGTAVWREMHGADPRAVLHAMADKAKTELTEHLEAEPEPPATRDVNQAKMHGRTAASADQPKAREEEAEEVSSSVD